MRRIGTAVIAALALLLIFALVAVGASLRMPALAGGSWVRVVLLFAVLLGIVTVIAGLLPWRVLRAAARERDALGEALAARRDPAVGAVFPEVARRASALLAENRELAARATELSSGVDREERLAAIGRLAAGLAHELRNPLTTVIGMAALARERCGEDALARDLAAIEAEARRCEAISESILAFSRTPRIQAAPVRIEDLLVRPMEGLEVSFEATAEARSVVADSILLGRVFANLMANAREAGAGAIRVRAERTGSLVRIAFADDGRGIPAALLEHLFDAFATTKSGGLGLGLAICRGIVSAHGGELSARNRPEGGAEFLITLPVAGPRAPGV